MAIVKPGEVWPGEEIHTVIHTEFAIIIHPSFGPKLATVLNKRGYESSRPVFCCEGVQSRLVIESLSGANPTQYGCTKVVVVLSPPSSFPLVQIF